MRARSLLPFQIAVGKKRKTSARSKDGITEELLIFLKKPRTKEEIGQVFPLTYRTEKLLRSLVNKNVVFKRKFTLSGKGVRHTYNALTLFGDLAFKTYYCRYDSAEEFANLIINQSVVMHQVNLGFKRSLTSHLKNLLPRDVFRIVHTRILAQSHP